ncbi:methylated-DNA--[protein]-cysteine S-methyltransferase [Synoicihabitans lomoniglobus]|uniref:methylated-DNA--[protein]-cysteine S-methyltransferase n=1 Tax=Synoicihabitans lomoniglobus TaxID=2909285 RepID=A0AAF0I2G7_9BACT|nr:methylated-DNA--[protein]-cysteine S-methyltransferase [Opitutaceae bacterium LMO-M01]WED66507.1 methylated-DNA--[protein]-cysteine S-methyltransferase [Opitutaceae bacterium LMO-M01]
MSAHNFATAIGDCSISWDGDVVTGFALLAPAETSAPAPAWVNALIARVQSHLRGEPQDFTDVAYAWHQVSDFQASIYHAALKIKSGQTATYGDLARAIGQPPAVSRAVGTALGQNPWPLLVPCHRFIGANGKMTGFSARGGITTKLQLLAIEGSELFPA